MSFFWNGYVLRDFIFLNFNTNTIPGFIGLFIALFSVGVLYEGLFYLKKDLLQKFLILKSRRPQTARQSCAIFEAFQQSESDDTAATTTDLGGAGGDANNPRNSLLAGEDLPVDGEPTPSSSIANIGGGVSTRRIISLPQSLHLKFDNPETIYLFTSSILHGCYAFIGYTLMNAVMTFNVGVFVAICAGIGVGYLFFRTDSSIGGAHQKRTSSQPFRNTIETDDDTEYHSHNERDPLQRSPTSSSSSNKHKTDHSHLHTPVKSPGSPGGGSRHSRTSGGSGRKSRNRMDQQNNEESHHVKVDNHHDIMEHPEGSPPAAAQVIVVGAQVHNNYQQSV